ncbi:MAG: type IX secretion system membrane protein PorP/SprF [Candidatus Amulumruptor caecigallinarius]|nr:type IX secretion system membrane protein PorP/SprF [Candidatus Amulumruptor caecigallinarius]MCM1396430.1 type IX secretion system membrane protein PorP/SprF [Candidatus Amulumruptor caecigallinarius]MCM1453513.1 type IX secretion system membrane protein PorP/SprF [bacterium]
MRRLLTIITTIIACFATVLHAQTEPMLTQYFEVPSYYNPGAIGRTDNVRFRAGARLQWVGVDNAPTTFLLTADMPLKLLGKRWGIGLVMQQDKAGLYTNMSGGLQIAYKQKLGKGTLTGGIQLGIVNEGFKGSEVKLDFDDDYHSGTDDAIPTTDVNGTAFDMGLGVMYDHPLFYAGLSCTHLLEPTINFSGESLTTSEGTATTSEARRYQFDVKRSLYFIGGSNIPIKNTLFEVMPSVLVATDLTTYTFEATARARWKKFLTFGVGYRYNDAVSAMVAGEYKGFFLSYSYDYPVTAMSRVSSGSHEIMAGYSLKLDLGEKNRNRHKSIRIM